jgi:hypothetical protein
MNPSENENPGTAQCGEGALRNLRLGLTPEKRLPDKLFARDWSHFRLFNSDEIFVVDFVDKVRMLLQIEGAGCACMANLDVNFSSPQRDAFFLNRSTTPSAYLEHLKGDIAGTGWIDRMDRFGITSDIGSWLIYCEKANEIAIIAFRSEVKLSQFNQIVTQIGALPVKAAISKPVCFVFASGAMSKEWSDRLIETYPE